MNPVSKASLRYVKIVPLFLLLAVPKIACQSARADSVKASSSQTSNGDSEETTSLLVLMQQLTDNDQQTKALESSQRDLIQLVEELREQQESTGKASVSPSNLLEALKAKRQPEAIRAFSDLLAALRTLRFSQNPFSQPEPTSAAYGIRKEIENDVRQAFVGIDDDPFFKEHRYYPGLSEAKPKLAEIQKLANGTLTKEKLDNLKIQVARALQRGSEQAQTAKTKVDEQISALKSSKAKIETQMNKVGSAPRIQITEKAISWGLPIYLLSVLFLVALPITVHYRYGQRDGNNSTLVELLRSGILIETSTVLLLTITILILGLAEKLQGEVLGTLLGGISGYVLNRAQSTMRGRQDPARQV